MNRLDQRKISTPEEYEEVRSFDKATIYLR